MLLRSSLLFSSILKDFKIQKGILYTLRNFSQAKKSIIRNEAIRANSLRVIYDDENGKSVNEILSKKDALEIAKDKKLDLILINESTSPPLCKIESYINMIRDIKAKESEQRKKLKATIPKEINIGATIDQHDLGIKMKKVNELLEDGYQVKVIIFATKAIMEAKPLAIDETTLRVLDILEQTVNGPVVPSSKALNRVDFILSPKKNL